MTNGKQSGKGTGLSTPGGGIRAKALWRRTQIVLFLAGIVLLVLFGAARLDSYFGSQAALEAFDALSDAPAERPEASEPAALDASAHERPVEEHDFQNWNGGRVRAYKAGAARHVAVPIGVLEIPAIHLVAPLFEGTDALTLNRGAGRIAGTARIGQSGNIGIAAHRDGFFRGLKDVKSGDMIALISGRGADVYTIGQIQIVSPHDVGVLRPQSRPAVTLVTCYPFYFTGRAPQRYIVTGFLTQHTPIEAPDSATR